MREIVLDTETTGINPRDGHRIIEIGALELMHHLPTGKELHIYINPEREIDDGAVAVHGLTSSFLSLSLIHISEPTRRRGISYAVFCLKKKI